MRVILLATAALVLAAVRADAETELDTATRLAGACFARVYSPQAYTSKDGGLSAAKMLMDCNMWERLAGALRSSTIDEGDANVRAAMIAQGYILLRESGLK